MKNQLACLATLFLGRTTILIQPFIKDFPSPRPDPRAAALHDDAPGADAVLGGQLHELGRVPEPGAGDGLPPPPGDRRPPLLLMHHGDCAERSVSHLSENIPS